MSEKEAFLGIDYQEAEEFSNRLALYEATGNSEICTVVNTSILPYSYETTEREFSPFSTSPVMSPRIPLGESMPTVFLTTEATANKKKCKIERPKIVLLSEEDEEGFESSCDVDCSGMNSSNYLGQHRGDDDECPSCVHSACHSREASLLIE